MNTSLISSNSIGLAATLQLRDYQQSMIVQTYQLIRDGVKRILLIAVMGSGKTIIMCWIMRDAARRGRKCVFLVSRNVLLPQTEETLLKLGVHCTILQGDHPVDETAPVIIASLQSLAAKMRKGKTLGALLGCPDVIIADEAHETAFHATYEAIDNYFPDAVKLGCTATPSRLSKREWLGQKFEATVVGPQPPQIVKLSGAVVCRGFSIGGVLDLTTLKIRNGDYVDSEIAAQATKPEAIAHVISEIKRLCRDRSLLVVGSTVAQAHLYSEALNAAGITCEVVIGSTSDTERRAIFERVRNGQTQAISAVGCLSVGFDLPKISAIVYVRATQSRALFQQTAGRGSRTYPGKQDYLLLDFGGNLKRFGNPMGLQDYDINKPAKEDNPAPTKTCPECKAEINQFLRVCPHCGFEFCGEEPTEEQLEELVLGQLNEFCDRFTREKIQKLRQWRKASYQTNLSPDDAIARFHSEYGHNPPPEWLLHACLTKRYSPRRQAEFAAWLWKHCNTQSRWAKQWIAYHLRLEFGTESLDVAQWWDILNVEPGSSWEQVKQAYSQLSANFDPSCYAGEDSQEQIERLNLALEDAKDQLSVIAVQGGAL